MPKKIHRIIRMCVSCRDRHSQDELLRLKCTLGKLEVFNGSGRTFYVCDNCLSNEKKLSRALMRQCKSGDKDKLMNKLKEIITDDR